MRIQIQQSWTRNNKKQHLIRAIRCSYINSSKQKWIVARVKKIEWRSCWCIEFLKSNWSIIKKTDIITETTRIIKKNKSYLLKINYIDWGLIKDLSKIGKILMYLWLYYLHELVYNKSVLVTIEYENHLLGFSSRKNVDLLRIALALTKDYSTPYYPSTPPA